MRKTVLLGVLALAFAVPAFAEGGMDAAPSGMLVKFFTDDSMTTMRSTEEMKAAWTGMSAGDQKWLKDNCATNASPRYEGLCKMIGGM